MMWEAICAFAPAAIVVAWMFASEARETRRQRRYRDALARGDWDEVHRLMGFDE